MARARLRYDSTENYLADRLSNIDSYRSLFSQFVRFPVLELGCSQGYLLHAFQEYESFRALGADIDPMALSRGKAAYPGTIEFLQATHSTIPLPDSSVDVIYTVDTVEHLAKPHEIFQECHRVLRPGGSFLVHFCPWLGPYGSHLEDR